jgi:ABC-type transport system involved in cytochrome c biogenesis permease component
MEISCCLLLCRGVVMLIVQLPCSALLLHATCWNVCACAAILLLCRLGLACAVTVVCCVEFVDSGGLEVCNCVRVWTASA